MYLLFQNSSILVLNQRFKRKIEFTHLLLPFKKEINLVRIHLNTPETLDILSIYSYNHGSNLC